ncbi:hypothetical protein IFR05_004863 [Cadophora sp. M221]|nr:hypothetical protein IFR05_004863 [Cadophora sp. M221]
MPQHGHNRPTRSQQHLSKIFASESPDRDSIGILMPPSPESIEGQTRIDLRQGMDDVKYEKMQEQMDEVAISTKHDSKQWNLHMAHVRDSVRELNLQMEKHRCPSPPQSYMEFLRNRAQGSVSYYEGPDIKPANGPNPTLEQIARLFQQLKNISPQSILFDSNDRIYFRLGNPDTAPNITAVVNDCRDRYLGDRTALVRALGRLLEVEKLVRLPLGRRRWDNFDLNQTKIRDEWRTQCRKHIDDVMAALEKVEAEMARGVYTGNWEPGWTDYGLFPRGRRGMEIGNRENYSSSYSE